MARLGEGLVRLAEIYAEARMIQLSTLSSWIFKDSRLLPRLTEGGSTNLDLWEHAVTWLSSNWPEDRVWPEEIAPRPIPDAALVRPPRVRRRLKPYRARGLQDAA